MIRCKVRKTRIVYLPGIVRSRNLLGADFLEHGGIVVNIAKSSWYFEDEPKPKYLFTNPFEVGVFSMDFNGNECSSCTKAMGEVSKLTSLIKGKLHHFQIHQTIRMIGERTLGEISTLFALHIRVRKNNQDRSSFRHKHFCLSAYRNKVAKIKRT